MPSAAAAPGSKAAAVEGAVVFTDIVGFTEFTAVQGDGAAADLLTRQEELVTTALPEKARIVKELGDGLMLWFADPAEAIECCLELQSRFEAHSEETLMPLWVRMGLHWGTQTKRREDLIGHDVNLASRVSQEAGPGELLLTAATVTRVDDSLRDIDFERLGPTVMKGIPEPVYLYRAHAADPELDFDD